MAVEIKADGTIRFEPSLRERQYFDFPDAPSPAATPPKRKDPARQACLVCAYREWSARAHKLNVRLS
jgi:hypothetical protein